MSLAIRGNDWTLLKIFRSLGKFQAFFFGLKILLFDVFSVLKVDK